MHPVLEHAVGKLVLQSPFISCILLSTDVLEATETSWGRKIDTAATDGNKIWINMGFIESLAPKDKAKQIQYCKTILAHEVWHIALLHPFRLVDRNEMLIDANGNSVLVKNLAADGVVNPMLKLDGFDLPGDAFMYPNGENMSMEEIFEELLKKYKNNPQVKAISIGDVLPNQGNGDKEGSQGDGQSIGDAELKAKLMVQKALDVAKAEGKMPASLQRLVEKALESKVPWKELLREAITTIMKKDDFSWRRFNRRYVHQRLYLPGMDGEQCGPIAVATDTSGSVGGTELEAFLGELNAIFDEVKPEKIYKGFCDARFYGWNELTEDDLPMTPADFSKIVKGGGGTAFSPVFRGVEDEKIEIELLVYFTDLCGSDFGPKPDYPVIWVTTHSTEAPWGTVIKIDL